MKNETAEKFAHNWIAAWNNHDIEEILSHYADNIQFYSPFIPLLKFNDSGLINNKTDLRAYFEIGLRAYPTLYFQLHTHFSGVNSLVIYYTSVNNRQAAEVFELDEQNKATKVYCHYTEQSSI
jgi:hypothetical protein